MQKPKKKSGVQKDYIWNPSTCTCKNSKYLASIIDDSVITCDEIMETTIKIQWKSFQQKRFQQKTITSNFNKKRQLVKQKISIF